MYDAIFNYLNLIGLSGLLITVFILALGIPFPASIVVITAGCLVSQEKINLYTAFFVLAFGFTAGASTAFYLGKHIGEPVLIRLGKYLHLNQSALRIIQDRILQSSAAFILTGRFIPLISNITPYLAGISKITWKQFLFYNTIFVLNWSGFYLYLGILFGSNLDLIMSTQARIPTYITSFLIFIFFFRFLLWRRKAI